VRDAWDCLIAHRGASADAPENTLAAIDLAWRQGARAVEIDIRLTRDGAIVLMHDADARRVAGAALTVAESDLAALQALDAGAWKGAAWAGERIPTLEQALATIPPGARLVVEIKSGAEIVEPLKQALDRAALPPGAIELIGFDPETMRLAKAAMPRHRALFLAGRKAADAAAGRLPQALIEQARGAGLDGLDLQASLVDGAAFAKAIRDAGLALYVYTVNDAAEARRLLEIGVDAVTTDAPAALQALLRTP